MSAIADVQKRKRPAQPAINQVGIKDLRFPIQTATASGIQSTVARLTMTVRLPADQKGTHMSRFVALMESRQRPLDYGELQNLTQQMLELLGADAGRISVSFPFFRSKSAPVSGIRSLLDYDVTISGEVSGGAYAYGLKVLVPVTSLCPCSKEISQYGAHNQRSHVTVSLICTQDVRRKTSSTLSKHKPPASSTACSNAPTKNTLPNAPTKTRNSSKTSCATSPPA